MRKTVLACCFLFSAASVAFSFQQPPPGNTGKNHPRVINPMAKARIDSTLRSFVNAGKVAGVSALIFEKNQEVYYNAFGAADREAKVPMDRRTIVRIYSMTKPVTGVALMTLYEKGAFQLDDPLSKYAPEFANMNVYKGVDAAGKRSRSF